jgi:hypothetical protein
MSGKDVLMMKRTSKRINRVAGALFSVRDILRSQSVVSVQLNSKDRISA